MNPRQRHIIQFALQFLSDNLDESEIEVLTGKRATESQQWIDLQNEVDEVKRALLAHLTVEPFRLDPPIDGVATVDVEEHDDGGMFDLFQAETGNCLNEGCPFPFVPTLDEVKEFLSTGKIKGKIE